MPDITVSFTDAQWTRIVAAYSYIKAPNNGTGNIDANYLADFWKDQISEQVKAYEKEQASISDF